MGSAGPSEINPDTGEPWGLSFPVITIADMVRAQKRCCSTTSASSGCSRCSADRWAACRCSQWASLYPERVFAASCRSPRRRTQRPEHRLPRGRRQAIMADPDWARRRLSTRATRKPTGGPGVARMAAHITYLSETALHRKFGRNASRAGPRSRPSAFNADFQIESYLRHQGLSFVERFDANAYLYLTRAMDYFDLAAGSWRGARQRIPQHAGPGICVMSFTSPTGCFPTAGDSRAIVHALNAASPPIGQPSSRSRATRGTTPSSSTSR